MTPAVATVTQSGETSSDAKLSPRETLDLLADFSDLAPYLTPDEERQIARLLETVALPPLPLVEFIRGAWRVVEPHTPYNHNWHIDAIADHLTAATFGLIRRLLVNIQPRHMKSLLVSVFWPAWVWTFRPASQWLFLSYAQSISIRDNLKRRRIIESSWYRYHFGEAFELTTDQRQKGNFQNDQGGHMIALGLGGTGQGGDFIVADDLLAREQAYSVAYRDRAITVWDETVSTRGNDPRTVVKVMIAQRLHEGDPPGHIMTKESEGGEVYDRLIIPTEFEPDARPPATSIGWTDPRTEPGALLWPERYDAATIATLKTTLGSMAASAQLQQRPTTATGTILDARAWRFWRPRGVSLPLVEIKIGDGTIHRVDAVELPDVGIDSQSWDCAFKDNADSSYVVGQAWRKVDANIYLLDQERDQMNLPATIDAIRRLSARYPSATAKLVEDKANGPAVVQTLRSEIPGLLEVSPQGDKISRAHAASPFVESGNVYLPHPGIAPWVYDFIDECRNFPAAVYNDQVDAFTQYVIWTTRPPEKKKRARAVRGDRR